MHIMQWMLWSLILNCWIANTAISQEKHSMNVRVSGISETKGSLMIAVYDQKEHFLGDKAVLYQRVPVKQVATTACVLELPLGTYAIAVYHDLNDNQELDTNFLGVPKEPIGCSRGAVGTLGPPPYEKAVFEFTQAEQEVAVPLK